MLIHTFIHSFIHSFIHPPTHPPTHLPPQQAQEGYQQQHGWVEKELREGQAAGATHLLLFAHHPFFLQKDDEVRSFLPSTHPPTYLAS